MAVSFLYIWPSLQSLGGDPVPLFEKLLNNRFTNLYKIAALKS